MQHVSCIFTSSRAVSMSCVSMSRGHSDHGGCQSHQGAASGAASCTWGYPNSRSARPDSDISKRFNPLSLGAANKPAKTRKQSESFTGHGVHSYSWTPGVSEGPALDRGTRPSSRATQGPATSGKATRWRRTRRALPTNLGICTTPSREAGILKFGGVRPEPILVFGVANFPCAEGGPPDRSTRDSYL